jgi:hypothetical protein
MRRLAVGAAALASAAIAASCSSGGSAGETSGADGGSDAAARESDAGDASTPDDVGLTEASRLFVPTCKLDTCPDPPWIGVAKCCTPSGQCGYDNMGTCLDIASANLDAGRCADFCYYNSECQTSCPSVSGSINCCDRNSFTCYLAHATKCPVSAVDAGAVDAGAD